MTDQPASGNSHCWLEGDRYIVLARRWTHGEYSGLTAVKVYSQIDEYDHQDEMANNMAWPETTSEDLVKGLAEGTLRCLEIVVPEGAPHGSG
jgi:hypothetical protein